MKKFQKVALVLGAGASKGAILKGEITPPLDTEFLKRALIIFGKKGASSGLHNLGKEDWKKFTRKLEQIGLDIRKISDWRLETLTTYLEARKNVSFENKSGHPPDYATSLKLLNRIVCYVFTLSGGTQSCVIHKAMVRFLNPRAIISFNYDLIMDQSLQELKKLDWAKKEYSTGKTMDIWSNGKWHQRKWFFNKRRPSIEGKPFYKLHGSIHWRKLKRGGGYILSGLSSPPSETGELFKYSMPPVEPFIIPPVAAKMSISDSSLRALWKKAHKELKAASTWIIWGYSLPQTDTLTSVLLKTCVGKSRKHKKIVIINPDLSISKRVEALLVKGNVEQYGSAADFLLKYGQLRMKDGASRKVKKIGS